MKTPRDTLAKPNIRGEVGLYRVWTDGSGRVDPINFKHNQIQVFWGNIAAQCIGLGNKGYQIQGLYIEFENVAGPSDPADVPDFAPTDGLDYYSDLLYSGTKDYLRVPLIQTPLLGIAAGYEDSFVSGVSGNTITVFAQTQGTQGVNGKPFADTSNSKVAGVALVAVPNWQDKSQDVIFARTYFAGSDQVAKQASSQIGVTWEIQFLL